MMIDRVKRFRRCGIGVVAMLAGLTGCMLSDKANSPIEVPSDAGDVDVRVEAEFQVDAGQVKVNYRLHNGSGDKIWFVHRKSPPAIPDHDSDGVVLALAFFPIRTDVDYYTPPTEVVQPVEPSAVGEGVVQVPRPFMPFDELEGGESVRLPSEPKQVRLCVAYVPDSIFADTDGPSQRDSDPDKYEVPRDVAVGHQRFACSEAVTLD